MLKKLGRINNFLNTDLDKSSASLIVDGELYKIYFDQKEEVLKQINFFQNRKDWYLKRGKPYTLGICGYGPPGCGKTSFEKSLAKYPQLINFNIPHFGCSYGLIGPVHQSEVCGMLICSR